jgi:uncharacterized membrane protein
MTYKIYLASSAVFFLLMVLTGVWALVTGRLELVLWVAGLFILAMIAVQMARRSAKKELEKVLSNATRKREDR